MKSKNHPSAVATRWRLVLPLLAVLGLPAAVAADESSDNGEAKAEPPREELAPLLDALDSGDQRRGWLTDKVAGFFGADSEQAAARLATDDGRRELRGILEDHGFAGSDLDWLGKLPAEGPEGLRGAVTLLHAGLLLRHGPPRLDGQWPEWNEGETPGEGGPDTFDPQEAGKAAAERLPDGIGAALEPFIPQNPIYRKLRDHHQSMKANLETLRQEFIAIPALEEGEIVKAGDAYPSAEILAKRLAEEGFLDDPDEALDDKPEVYSEALAEAVKRFQRHQGRADDGILGPDTLTSLNRSPDDELEILRLNMHRARLLPDELGSRYVITNIPSANLVAFEHGGDSPDLAMKVIVGEVNRETPMFRDVMQVVEFAPYWNVPTSIARRDIVPQARRDQGYLERRGYEIVASYGAIDTRPATSGNLSAVASGNLLIRQTPGDRNAMGRVKFLFPNEYAIYLHDTPQEELFEESERDFSNGCIRVEDPQALGVFVLGPQGWDAGKVSEHMDGDSSERVEVEEIINIYIVYFTAFPTWGEEEPVKFYPDIYKLDEDRL